MSPVLYMCVVLDITGQEASVQKSEMVPYIRLMRLKKSTTGQESEYEQPCHTIYGYLYTLVNTYVCTWVYIHIHT